MITISSLYDNCSFFEVKRLVIFYPYLMIEELLEYAE